MSEEGYWGPVTASIDWCETNYAWSPFIAEFWNTLSSLAIFFAGIYGWRIAVLDDLETRFQVMQLLVAGVGVGSACFHCTLRHVEQQCDETPMVLTLLNWFYELFADTWESNSFLKAVIPVLLVVYGTGFALLHNSYRWTTFFQVHFAVGAMMNLARCIYVSREKGVGPARGLLKRAMIATVVAGFCWMTDFHFCGHFQTGDVPNPEGHAWWHLFIAYAILQTTSFLIYRRCAQLGIPVVITKGPLGIWPTVRVVRQATGSKALRAVEVGVATKEPRVLPRSKSDPRFTTVTCQASALRLRKYGCNSKI
eukprot:g7998.t1